MNKFFVAVLAAGAAAAAGYVASKILKGDSADNDYDDDIYDDYEVGGDDNIDFEINDDTVKDAVENAADAAEDAAEDIKDAAEDAVDAVKDAADEIKD